MPMSTFQALSLMLGTGMFILALLINTNARDAVHVIDGLLHHETDLHIEEHYTDTAGYTDQVFGLTNLLGFRFAPRLRDLAK